MVSVIIPCYNSSATINRAIQSVLNQSYQNFEIIVIDDASKDSEITKQLLIAYNDPRISFIQHQINKNGSAARNTGIKIAKGEFIALLDSDDEWYPEHLMMSRNLYNEQINKNTVIYCKELVKTSHFKDIIVPAREIAAGEDVGEYLFCNDGFIQTSSLFIPKFILLNNMFNETLIRHQDYELVLKLFKSGIVFAMVNQVNVILHWEGNDIEKKGGTWDFSLNWAKQERRLLTRKAYKYFVLNHAIFPLLQKKQRFKGLRLFLENCLGFYPLKKTFKILSVFFFGRIIFSKI
jgi:glycosyltransferase involved in cell wall biosynthesis